jgi:hypothetical protein
VKDDLQVPLRAETRLQLDELPRGPVDEAPADGPGTELLDQRGHEDLHRPVVARHIDPQRGAAGTHRAGNTQSEERADALELQRDLARLLLRDVAEDDEVRAPRLGPLSRQLRCEARRTRAERKEQQRAERGSQSHGAGNSPVSPLQALWDSCHSPPREPLALFAIGVLAGAPDFNSAGWSPSRATCDLALVTEHVPTA